eukprot:COSAG01_NODE_6614_length_3581_cov_1.071018_4_plen_167_part_00
MSGTSCNAAPGRLYTAGLPYTPLRPLRVAARSSSSNCANQHTSAQSPPPWPFAMSAHNICMSLLLCELRSGEAGPCGVVMYVVGWHGSHAPARAVAGRAPPGASTSGAPCPHPGRGRGASRFLDQNRRCIGKSQSERPPKRTQRPPRTDSPTELTEASSASSTSRA